jgi:hypothetical protein
VIDVRRLHDSLPDVFSSETRAQLISLTETLDSSRALFEHQPQLMAQLQAQANALQHQLAPIAGFFDKLRALAGNDGGNAQVVPRGGSAGINTNGDNTPVPQGVSVQTVQLDCARQWTVGQVTDQVTWSRKGARIVKLEVISNWPELNGNVVSFSGGIGSDNVHVGFEADYDRGFNWTVLAHFVDCDTSA